MVLWAGMLEFWKAGMGVLPEHGKETSKKRQSIEFARQAILGGRSERFQWIVLGYSGAGFLFSYF